MSFLMESDESATVHEAIAFIDSWPQLELSGSSAEGEGSSGNDSTATPDERQEKQKKRRASGYSLKFQRRKKEELASLRDQAESLEVELRTLTQLGRPSRRKESTTKLSNSATKSKWHSTAMIKFRELQEAEKTKRKLLELLRNQAHVNNSVRRLLRKTSLLPGFEDLLTSHPLSPRHPLAQSDDSAMIIAQLEGVVSSMRMECGFMLEPLETLSTSSTMLVKHNENDGKMVEITTITPMTCSMEAASAWLWDNLSALREYRGKSYNYLRQSRPDTVEKSYLMELRGRTQAIHVNGLQLLRKYEEADRVMLVRSNLLLLPTESLQFRNNCWTTITPSATNPRESVVRTCVQLYAESKDGLSIQQQDFDDAKNLALNALSGMYRDHANMIQNALIEEGDGATMILAT
ncbi:hypothetical protein PRNP1_012794 [Phytophthora ramorum]